MQTRDIVSLRNSAPGLKKPEEATASIGVLSAGDAAVTKSRQPKWLPYLMVLPMTIFLGVLFVYPLVQMAISTLVPSGAPGGDADLSPFADLFGTDRGREMIFRTLRVGILTTILSFVLAYPITLWIREVGPRLRGILIVIMLSPLLTSVVVRTLGWVSILGSGGLIDNSFGFFGLEPPAILYTEGAIILGLAHVYLGFMVLSLLSSVLRIPDDVIGAAANLGARSHQILFRIALPLSLPGIVGGCAIVFPLAASSYVTAALLGGSRIPVMGTEVYREAMINLNWGSAAAIGLTLFIMIGIGIVLLGLLTRASSRRSAL